MNYFGYVLLTKPAAITMAEWRTVLLALYPALNVNPDHPNPSHRLHYRLSLDNTRVIIQADFSDSDLTIDSLARTIRAALGNRYTLAQVKAALANNVQRMDHAAITAYLAASRADWETEAD